MTLHVGEPPVELTDGVREVLRRRAEKGRFSTPVLGSVKAEELTVGAPHRVYTMTLEDVAEQRSLDTARFTSWRYLVYRGDRAVAGIEVPDTEVEDLEGRIQVNEGQFVGATSETVAMAEALDEVERSGYELRLLKILPLYTVALWLRPDGDDPDLLIPMGQAHPAVESGRVYRAAEFLEALSGPASEAARFDNRPQV